MQKKLIISGLMFLSSFPVFSQNECFIDEKMKQLGELKYDVLFIHEKSENDSVFHYASVHRIEIRGLNPEEFKCFLYQENKKELLSMMQGDKFDYELNLILYHLTKRNALVFTTLVTNNKKKEWKRYLKSEDLEYWRKNL